MPAEAAFWTYGILYGTALNVVTTLATFALLIQGAPMALAVAMHFLPLPYNVLAVVGVLRNPDSSQMARTLILMWAVAVTVA